MNFGFLPPKRGFMDTIFPKSSHVWECLLVDFVILNNRYNVITYSHLSKHFCIMFYYGIVLLKWALYFSLGYFSFHSRCLHLSFHVLMFSNITWIGLVENSSVSFFSTMVFVPLIIKLCTLFMYCISNYILLGSFLLLEHQLYFSCLIFMCPHCLSSP